MQGGGGGTALVHIVGKPLLLEGCALSPVLALRTPAAAESHRSSLGGIRSPTQINQVPPATSWLSSPKEGFVFFVSVHFVRP